VYCNAGWFCDRLPAVDADECRGMALLCGVSCADVFVGWKEEFAFSAYKSAFSTFPVRQMMRFCCTHEHYVFRVQCSV